ncbi:hypothetical protein UPYG_G00177110 [Umbra pygmaea]|uniref:Uncharacterized protein n=1 Tax=Umbra pygmaea TaxID=75934 RepID=A0ABD0WPW8_UMBPY
MGGRVVALGEGSVKGKSSEVLVLLSLCKGVEPDLTLSTLPSSPNPFKTLPRVSTLPNLSPSTLKTPPSPDNTSRNPDKLLFRSHLCDQRPQF